MEEGTRIKHYRIVSRLGEGGMGVVYRAEDTRLGRTVALKVLSADLALSKEHLQRFEREARAASSISHPGVATLYDFDRDGETTFLTMEFVEGKTLRELVEETPPSIPQVIDCLAQIAEALSAAHRKGVVHRDLKPENVMAADSGYYKILDFGLARVEQREEMLLDGSRPTQWATVTRQMTREGKIVGTFAYMSPEQVQGHPVDGRSDIFSFGVVARELVTGTLPFQGNNAIATFHAIVHGELEPMSSARDDVPPALERIVAKCLAKDAGERYQSAADLAVDMRGLRRDSQSGSLSFPSVPGFPSSASRPRRRMRPGLVGAIAGAAVLAVLVLWAVGWGGGRGSATFRSAPETPVGGAPAPLAAAGNAAGRNRIAVVPFANASGDPASDWLRGAIPEMLTTDLAQSGELELISTQRLSDLAAAAGRGAEEMDQATATELARWAKAGVVVGGSIFKAGDAYRIDVQASDTVNGDVIAAHRVEGTDVFSMADEIADALRRGLQVPGDPELEIRGIEQVTTASTDAFRRFSDGMKLFQDVQLEKAADAFRASLDADPTFPQAKLRLGMSLFLLGDVEEGRTWIEQAREESARMPERERMLTDGFHYSFTTGDLETGDMHFEEMSRRFPGDEEALFWSAQAQSSRAGNAARAIRTLHQALQRNPDSPFTVAALVAQLQALRMDEDAAKILDDFLSRHPEIPAERLRELELSGPAGD